MTVDLLWVLLGFGGWISRSSCLVGLYSRDDNGVVVSAIVGAGPGYARMYHGRMLREEWLLVLGRQRDLEFRASTVGLVISL